MIFNQGPEGKCKNFSIICALHILNPKLDLVKLLEETKRAPNLLTNNRAALWFSERWYLKWFQDVPTLWWARILAKKWIPILVTINWIDWQNTSKDPFIISVQDRIGAHSFCIIWYDSIRKLFKCQNSYWDKWWDHGYFYLPEALWNKVQTPAQILL